MDSNKALPSPPYALFHHGVSLTPCLRVYLPLSASAGLMVPPPPATTGHLSGLLVSSALLTSPGVRMVVSRGITTILPGDQTILTHLVEENHLVRCLQARFQERFQRLLGSAYKKMCAHGWPGEENRCGGLARNRYSSL